VAACILTPEDIWPDGLPELDDKLALLRSRVFSEGICAADFNTLMLRGDDAFQVVFGERVLVKVEFDVARFGEHSHLVYVPLKGRKPEIITAFPKDGKLRVMGPQEWGASPHSPLRHPARLQRIGVIASDFGPDRWRRVSMLAHAIDEAGLNYNFLFQNSNSLVATLADAAEIGFVDLPGGGLNLGSGNLLYDELMGGSQAPRLLIRGGTSHSGPIDSPTPKQVPESAATDG
jgi:hypothetical protein